MDYSEFKALSEKPQGLGLRNHHSITGVPLDFEGEPSEFIEQLDDWGTFDDYRDLLEIESFAEDLPAKYGQFEAFATADTELLLERDPNHHVDSSLEFVLFVDTSKPGHPVHMLGCDTHFGDRPVFDTFEKFYADLAATGE